MFIKDLIKIGLFFFFLIGCQSTSTTSLSKGRSSPNPCQQLHDFKPPARKILWQIAFLPTRMQWILQSRELDAWSSITFGSTCKYWIYFVLWKWARRSKFCGGLPSFEHGRRGRLVWGQWQFISLHGYFWYADGHKEMGLSRYGGSSVCGLCLPPAFLMCLESWEESHVHIFINFEALL